MFYFCCLFRFIDLYICLSHNPHATVLLSICGEPRWTVCSVCLPELSSCLSKYPKNDVPHFVVYIGSFLLLITIILFCALFCKSVYLLEYWRFSIPKMNSQFSYPNEGESAFFARPESNTSMASSSANAASYSHQMSTTEDNNSKAISHEIHRFESVHPSIYAIYDLLDMIGGADGQLIAQRIRDHVVCIEGSYFPLPFLWADVF